MGETLSCWKWSREGCEDTFWGFSYPGAAEQYDTHGVTILSWESSRGRGGHDE